jgi:hypothetical protein
MWVCGKDVRSLTMVRARGGPGERDVTGGAPSLGAPPPAAARPPQAAVADHRTRPGCDRDAARRIVSDVQHKCRSGNSYPPALFPVRPPPATQMAECPDISELARWRKARRLFLRHILITVCYCDLAIPGIRALNRAAGDAMCGRAARGRAPRRRLAAARGGRPPGGGSRWAAPAVAARMGGAVPGRRRARAGAVPGQAPRLPCLQRPPRLPLPAVACGCLGG